MWLDFSKNDRSIQWNINKIWLQYLVIEYEKYIRMLDFHSSKLMNKFP